ncbi:MAG: T9SS type A sorting domain-containing protein [Bacteroidota bacterium]
MKKILFKTLCVASILFSVKTINAQCSLDQVGAPNYSTTCAMSDMAAAPTGSVYVVSYNTTSSKIFLHSATTAGSWTLITSLSNTTSVKPIIAINKTNGKVYVAFRDGSGGNVAKVFYLSGSTLVPLGGSVSGANVVTDLSIAFNSLGEEYVAYTDVTNANRSTVKKWNGSAWVNVGAGTVSSGAGYFNSLAIDNSDTPLLAFQDVASGNKTALTKYNGTSWVMVGILGTNTTNSKVKVASNNYYYLGYTETLGNANVQVFNGSVWNQLGSPVTNLSSSANSFDMDLDPNDLPIFTTILSTPPYPVAYKYAGVPTWSNVIGSGYLNSQTSLNTNVAFDATGNPYFFYVDQTNNNGLNVKTVTSPISISSQPFSVSRCNGQSGSFSIGAVGGAPTGYQWQVNAGGGFVNASAPYNNGTTSSLTFNANPTMNLNVVKCVVNVGCKNIISNPATLTVITPSSNLVPSSPTCFGSCDGTIMSTPLGGTGPYIFSWTPGGATTQNLTGACAGTYSLTTTDASGCTVIVNTNVTNPSPISSSISGNMTICNGSNTSLTVTAIGGTGPYTYSWTPSASLSSSTGSIVTASPTSTQTYTVTTTDAMGCTSTYTVMVTVNALPFVSASNVTICQGSFATLNASGSAHTYTWNPGNLVGQIQNVNPATTTTYTVVGTNTLTSCTNSATALVTVYINPTVNAGPSRTLTCANTSTTLAGSTTGGITYSWTGPGIVSGATTLNPTINATGTYDLTVTSAQGCTAGPSPVSVTQNITPPTPSASTGGTLTCSTTTASVIGGGGGTYNWSGPGIVAGATASTATVNLPGTYNLTVTAANGCTATANTTVTQNIIAPNPFASSSATVTCSSPNTTLTALPSSGVSYSWSGPGVTGSTTTQTTTANAGGNYTLAITSLTNGCTATFPFAVSQNTTNPSPTASTTGTLTCTTLTVSLNGGPAGLTYLWSGPGISGSTTTQNTTANAPGIYTLTALSAVNGCTANATTIVTQNVTPPTAGATNSGTLTCTTTTMNLSGTGGGTYVWNGPGILSGGTTTTPVINAPGCYTLIVTSANGCTATAVTCVSQNTTAPVTSTNVSGTLNCTLTSVNASASTAASPVTYNWAGAGITSATNISTITVNAGGIKNYTVTNTSNGCITTGSLNVLQNLLAASPTATATGTITCLTNTVQLSGNPPTSVTYTWAAPGGSSISSGINSQNAIGNGPGTYTLFVTMISSGCVNSKTVAVTQNTVIPNANAGMDQSLTCAVTTVTLSGSATPSTCTPVWTGGVSSGANSFTATASTIGTYTLTVTNPANGCSATDNVQVTANASVPTITVTVNGTLTCSNPTVNTSASSSAALPTYAWSGPSIVSGGSSSTATVDQPGMYTVTVTDIPTGCSATANINVTQDITAPNSVAIASPSIICSGSNTTLTAVSSADPNVDYAWSPGSLNGAMQNVSPLSTTLYSVVATNTINGCVVTETVNITVNALPSLSVTGTTNICNGSTTNLTASGATTYTWDSGANTTSISVTPSVTTTYTVNGIDGNGCFGSTPVTVSIIPNKSINGVVTSTTGLTGGDIVIYKYTAVLSHWDSLTITPIGGTYSFNNIDSGLYVLRATPTATNIQVTYAPNSISWQGATVINHGCTNNTSQNIDLIGFASYVVGPGVITGQIVEAFGFVPKMNDGSKPTVPGTPIGGIIVKGGKNPGGQMLVQTTTDAAGNYTLSGLPINTAPDDYFIFVDIPGLDTNSTYYHISVTGSTPVTGFNFNVDGEYINPVGSITGISNDNSVLENKITLFPNPANEKFTLEYELIQSANVQIDLYNILGSKVKTIAQNSFEEKNRYTHSVKLEDLSKGVYFVRLKINNSVTTVKLIVSQ